MRKRRVGVTAKSRQNEGNQATGTLQFGTEMAAPLVWRTPTGSCGKSCKSSADGSMATMAQEAMGRKQTKGEAEMARARRACHPLHRHPVATRPPVKAPLTARWGSALTGPGRVAGKYSAGKRGWQATALAVLCQTRLPLVGNEENSIGARNNAKIILDRGRPSHGSRDRQRAVPIPTSPARPIGAATGPPASRDGPESRAADGGSPSAAHPRRPAHRTKR